MVAADPKPWAHSAGGRPIFLHHSPHRSWDELTHPLLMVGGVHGDEPEGVELASRTLHWLRELNPEAKVVPWILIPCLNPDGYEAHRRTNDNGVDLNRNYPAQSWSADYKDKRYFPGRSAGSEPEVQGMVQLIEKVAPRLIIHCHSWNPCIVSTGPQARKDADYLAECTGYKVVDEIGYPTPGSLSQFGWHDRQIPIICIEEQEHVELNTIWPRFKAGIQKIFFDLSDRR